MPWELLERVIRDFRAFGTVEVGFFYIGESFTTMNTLVRGIQLATELGYENRFLTSNASLAFPDRVRLVIEAGLTSLKWSVNNYSEEQFTEVVQRPGRLFHQAIANIEEAVVIRNEIHDRTGHWCEISASRIRYDEKQEALMEPFFAEHVRPYIDHEYWLPLYTMGGAPIDQELELGMKPTAGNMGRVGALVEPIPCWAVFTEAHVTSCGNLSACCFDADGNWTMANLNEVSVADGWNSLEFQRLRKAHLKGDVVGTPCETCAMYS